MPKILSAGALHILRSGSILMQKARASGVGAAFCAAAATTTDAIADATGTDVFECFCNLGLWPGDAHATAAETADLVRFSGVGSFSGPASVSAAPTALFDLEICC
jgi:hypothetical protein